LGEFEIIWKTIISLFVKKKFNLNLKVWWEKHSVTFTTKKIKLEQDSNSVEEPNNRSDINLREIWLKIKIYLKVAMYEYVYI